MNIKSLLAREIGAPSSVRLRMRPITTQDVDNLLLIFGDPVAMEFWPALKTRAPMSLRTASFTDWAKMARWRWNGRTPSGTNP